MFKRAMEDEGKQVTKLNPLSNFWTEKQNHLEINHTLDKISGKSDFL